MPSEQLAQSWAEPNKNGKIIEPPLDSIEIDALSGVGITPETILELDHYGQVHRMIAREALAICWKSIKIAPPNIDTEANMHIRAVVTAEMLEGMKVQE